jgi:type III pantothenate kinase
MQSGIIYGYVSLIEGIIIRIQNEMAEKSKVIATGGWAGTIAHETPLIQAVNPDLTLIGLKIIYYMNRV